MVVTKPLARASRIMAWFSAAAVFVVPLGAAFRI